jgi:M6 family metalloprotease-like protein
MRFFLRTSGETLDLQGAEGTGLRSGQLVEVTGRLSGRRLLASHLTASSDTETATGACTATGEQKAVIILASFPSKELLSSVTPALVGASFFGTGRTLDTFLRESSFGQTWVTGDVLGPYVLDADYFDQPLAVRDAALRAAAPFTDLTQYNRIFVVAPQGQTGMDSGGMALLGCGQISSPQGNLNASSIWMGAESMVGQNEIVDIASHELGHGFGLEHARYADYSGEPLGPAGQAPAPWDSIHEYGDSFSSMGRGSAQWAAPHKSLLGWLQTGSNIETVSANGNFTLSPYEQQGNGQVLLVSRDASGTDWLWLEYRQPQGTFDSTLPTAAFAGVLVHYADPALTATLPSVDPATYTNLIDFHPSGVYANDPALHVGETWSDPYGSLTLQVNSATAAGLNVSVSYSPASTCPSSVGGSQSFGAAGGTGAIPVTASAACSWSAAASVPWISVPSSGSGTGNGSVNFTVAQNTDVSPRWGKITVGGAFVIVSQAGAIGSMTISPQSASFSAAGGNGEISVATSAPDLAWTMGWNVSWITDVECSCFSDIGPATVRYIVAANAGPARTGAITIGGIAFTITQDAGAPVPNSIAWTQLAPTDAPPARLDQAMAPFGHSGQAVLYGGAWDATFSSVTWLWDGSNWNALNPANNPGLLAQHAMVYDEARGNIVLFGGINASGVSSNQTWIWDGTNWRQMQPAVSPPRRFGHAMAYDPITQTTVMFGGYGDYGDANDTWTWDGANWTQAASPVSPLPRDGHAMAFDAMRGQIVLFGGVHSEVATTWYSDTWLWDATGWNQALTPTPPAARFGHVMAYHPALHAVVMVGGYGGKDVTDTTWNYDFHKETWLWDGQEWVQQFPENQPGPAYTLGAAYDDTKQALTVQLGDDLTCLSRGPKTFLLTGASPDLTAALTDSCNGTFTQGETGVTYTMTVTNAGPVSTQGTVTVTDTLPAALNATAMAGTGWTCSVSNLTCTRSDVLAAGAGYPPITLTVNVAANAPSSLTNTAAVSGGGGVNAPNNAANDTTAILTAGSFTLAASTGSLTLSAGGTGAADTITVSALNGFTGSVALTINGLPSGATATFSPTSITGSGTSTLTVSASSAAAGGSYPLTVTGTSGSLVQTSSITLSVQTFSLSVSPSLQSVSAGGSAQYTVTLAAPSGAGSGVSFGTTGLPSGATASFSQASLSGAGSTTLTITATSSLAAGSYPFTITGTSGGAVQSTPAAFQVNSFTLSVSGNLVVNAGGSGTVTVTVAATGTTSLSAAGLPSGATAAFNPASLSGPGTSILTINTTAAMPAGNSTFTITGANGGANNTATLTLGVRSFTVSASTNMPTATAGGSSATDTITVSAVNGFTGSVALTISGLPSGATGTFSPVSLANSGASTLTLSASGSLAGGTYPLIVTAASGSLVQTAHLTLAVQSFSLSESPATQRAVAGGRAAYSVTVAATGGFGSAVAFSATGLPSGATASFSPASVNGAGSATLTITTTSSLTAGSYSFTIKGASGSAVRSTAASLQVGTLTISASGSPAMNAGGSGTAIVTVTATGTLPGPTVLAVTGLPAGAAATFSPASISGSGTSTLTVTTAAGTPGGNWALTVTGSNGGVNKTAAVTLAVKDFTVSASTNTPAVIAGGSSTAETITIGAVNGFTGPVALAIAGLPSGATGTFSPASLTNSGMSTLTLAASSAVAGGTYPLTIRAASGALVQTAGITLAVKNFSLSIWPASQTIAAGSSGSYTVTLTMAGGYNSTVTFGTGGLPSGATATFSPASASASGTTTLTITTTPSVSAKSYAFTITGSNGTLVRSVPATLVQAAGFTLSNSPTSLTLTAGTKGTVTLTVAATSGLNGATALTLSGLPNGATGTFSPASISGSGSSTLTISTAAATPAGSSTVTITGTNGGSIVRTTKLALTVKSRA